MSSIAAEPAAPNTNVASHRLVAIGLSLIGLGILRGWSDGVNAVRYVSAFGPRVILAPRSIPWDEFAGLAWAAWPILLGVWLVSRRSPKLLKAAGIASLALGLDRALTIAVGVLFDSRWSTLYQGGYDRTLGTVLPHGWRVVGIVLAMSAWLALAAVCFLSVRRGPRVLRAETVQAKRARRKASGQMVNAGSTLFAAAVLAAAGWTTYITMLERLPWVRSWVIGPRTRRSRPFIETAVMRHAREAEQLLNEAQGLSATNDLLGARRAYVKAVNRFETLMEENPSDRYFRRQFALAANNLSWFLATCPDESVRDAETAIYVGKKAVAAIPSDGNSLNTLGVAQFRAGEYDSAWETFEKSMELREGGDSFDWYFMAQIEAKRKHPEQAKALYDKAVAWGTSFRPLDPELRRFRIEAAERLGLPKPEVAKDESGASPIVPISRFRPPRFRRGVATTSDEPSP